MGEANRSLEAKKELFKKEPEKFIHVDTIIIGIIKGDEGIKAKIDIRDPAELQMAYGYICGEYPFARSHALQLLAQANKSKIVTPPGK